MGKMENVQAVNDLLNECGIKTSKALVEFNATVEYQPANISDTTKVQIKTDTYHYGDIEIIPTSIIDLNVVHTGFIANFSTYQYNSNNKELIITGIAHPSKGGKPYKVTIKP